MARAKHPRPLLIGPDVDSRSLVVAGDRVCWFGTGAPPQTPGALRLAAGGAAIQSGPSLRLESDGHRDPGCAATSVVLMGSPEALAAAVPPVRARGVRVVAAVRVRDGVEAQRARAFHASNRDPLLRVGLASGPWDGVAALAEELGAPLHWDELACPAIVERHFGRRADLSPGALGDVVVMDGDSPRHVVVGGRLITRDGAAVPL